MRPTLPASPSSWPEAVQILGRHASVNLAHLTAARAAEVMRRSMPQAAPAAGSKPERAEDGTSARRYARLLVSEIKLYNEAAVQVGRQKRDLLERLKPEIERARKLYSQRISPTMPWLLFQRSWVQTLADGDPSLLGIPREPPRVPRPGLAGAICVCAPAAAATRKRLGPRSPTLPRNESDLWLSPPPMTAPRVSARRRRLRAAVRRYRDGDHAAAYA